MQGPPIGNDGSVAAVVVLASVLALALAGCGEQAGSGRAAAPAAPAASAAQEADHEDGRLGARPGRPTEPAPRAGLHRLTTPEGGTGLLLVPRGLPAGRAVPLVVSLHGAGNRATSGIRPLRAVARARRVVVLAPDARGSTWDRTSGSFGADTATIDGLLAQTFARVRVDRRRLALLGFSDGGSYTLSLGLTNGDLFSHLVALAPGHAAPERRRGRPPIWVAHGRRDSVLPFARTSEQLVPRLRRLGYRVTFRPFGGGHEVRPEIAGAAVGWVLRRAR
jgi:phospholipase/carboxylesterase